MILAGKHRRTSHRGIPRALEVRDYPDNVCPGLRCKGRCLALEHRAGLLPIHRLTYEQIKKAQR